MRPERRGSGRSPGRIGGIITCLAIGVVCTSAANAVAACNVIPPAIQPFRSALGSVDRPFAGPGDWLEISGDRCNRPDGIGESPAELLATVIFTPPTDAPVNAVVVTDGSCADATVVTRLDECRRSLGPRVGAVSCRDRAGNSGLPMLEKVPSRPGSLRIRFPDTDAMLDDVDDDRTLTGPAAVLVTRIGDPLPCGAVAETGCAGDGAATATACVDRLLASGSCTRDRHPEFAHFSALPPPTNFAALCTSPSPPCSGRANQTVRLTVDGDGDLLLPMDWTGILVRRDGVPVPRLLHADAIVSAFPDTSLLDTLRIPGPAFLESLSPEGRHLPPLFQPQADATAPQALALFGSADAPYTVLRIRRRSARGRCATTTTRDCAADFDCPAGEACVRYLACNGGANAGRPCTGGEAGTAECSAPGDVGDCATTTCTVCATGPRSGAACRSPADCQGAACAPGRLACHGDAQCPSGGQCGPALFDLEPALTNGVGPIEVTGVAAAAGDPVPLAGLLPPTDATTGVEAFVLEEAITERDLNGDGDRTDPVIVLQDRRTGSPLSVGVDAGNGPARGRALARIADGPFRFPAAAVGKDVVAFLESEPLQADSDTSGNGRVFENILRVYGSDGASLLPPATTYVADAAPVIDGRSLVTSDRFLFFRVSEAALAPQRTINLTAGATKTTPEPDRFGAHWVSLSADGRFVAFDSSSTNLVEGDDNGQDDVFVFDRTSGAVERVSVSSAGDQGDGPSLFPSISGDGRFVVFQSLASNLVPGDTNGQVDVFLRDRTLGTTTCLSLDMQGGPANGSAGAPVIAADGTTVAFWSTASDLVPGDTNGAVDLFVRHLGVTTRVSIATDGSEAILPESTSVEFPAVSADGRYVAFASEATNLVAGDTNDVSDVFVRDLMAGTTTRVSVDDLGGQRTTASTALAIAGDGGRIAYAGCRGSFGQECVVVHERTSGMNVATITDGCTFFRGAPALSDDGTMLAVAGRCPQSFDGDVFVDDLVAHTTEVVSVADGGATGDGVSGPGLALSAAGDVVAFTSLAGNLVPHDTNALPDVYVRDRAASHTTRVTTAAVAFATPQSAQPALSADGRFVTFLSDATNLFPNDANDREDVVVRDRVDDTTTVASVRSDGQQLVPGGTGRNALVRSPPPVVSADGRFVAFMSDAPGVVDGSVIDGLQVYVHDRQTGTTERASVGPGAVEGTGSFCFAMSADARFVAFVSSATNFAPDETVLDADAFVRDRLTGTTTRVSNNAVDGGDMNASAECPIGISDDGTAVVFASGATGLVEGDTNGALDVFLHDRRSGRTLLVSRAPDGGPANASSGNPAISGDGNVVTFESVASNLVPGDTNGVADVFAFDRRSGTIERVSVDADGSQRATAASSGSIPAVRGAPVSADGRFVVFESLTPGIPEPIGQVLLHDRLTGATTPLTVAGDGTSSLPAISADGTTAAFSSDATNLTAEPNPGTGVFVRGPDRTAVQFDRSGDGDVNDIVLYRFDSAAPGLPAVPLGPATTASVANGAVAFLRPESAGGSGMPGGVDLNGDGDADDDAVFFAAPRAAPQNLGRSATAVALSDQLLGALLSEAGEGRDLNGDGDRLDTVAALHPAAADGAWIVTGVAADAIVVRGGVLAMLASEAMQGADLNGDGDQTDRVLDVVALDGTPLVGVGAPLAGVAAEDIVAGGEPGRELIAVRATEAAAGRDLNGDGDESDAVLYVYDRESSRILQAARTIRPCRFETCDPRAPYRVGRDTVTFLTFECDEQGSGSMDEPGCAGGRGTDLNGNGRATDLVLQTLDVRGADLTPGTAVASAVLAATSSGVCTTTGTACVGDHECLPGVCFVPPGGCAVTTNVACTPCPESSCPNPCGVDGTDYCRPLLGQSGMGRCVHGLGLPCAGTADCRDPARPGTDSGAECTGAGQTFQQIASPLSATSPTGADGGGARVFAGTGRCVETLGISCDPAAAARAPGACRGGAVCERGTCVREQGVCRTSADCAAGAECRPQLITITAADVDGDEIPDAVDVCPTTPDPLQRDTDHDGVGDACDPTPGTCPAADGLVGIRCRLRALVDATTTAVPAGNVRAALAGTVDRSVALLETVDGQGRGQRRVSRRAARLLRVYVRRLTTKPVRRTVDRAARGVLRHDAIEAKRALERFSRSSAR